MMALPERPDLAVTPTLTESEQRAHFQCPHERGCTSDLAAGPGVRTPEQSDAKPPTIGSGVHLRGDRNLNKACVAKDPLEDWCPDAFQHVATMPCHQAWAPDSCHFSLNRATV